MMYGYWFGQYGWIGMLISMVFWILVVGGLVWLVVWAVRRSGAGSYNGVPMTGQSPKEIAQQRYARGEINREQYQQLLEDLNR
jgi:putative membrane protein